MNSRNKITALLVAGITISSCQTLDPYTQEEKTSQAAKGAMIGAAAGAVVGLISGDNSTERKKRALIGVGVGALAGGAVGAYQDQQEARLRAELEGTGVSVTRIGDNITLNMPGDVTFAHDSADLNPAFFEVLVSVAKVLKEFDKTLVEIAGHTDSTGSEAHNQELSERRASTVAHYLLGRQVDNMRVLTFGFGEARPMATNGTAERRQANRRVEIELVPVTQG